MSYRLVGFRIGGMSFACVRVFPSVRRCFNKEMFGTFGTDEETTCAAIANFSLLAFMILCIAV